MTGDWLIEAMDEVDRTSRVAQERLGEGRAILAPIRAERLAGVPLVATAEALAVKGLPMRQAAASAFQDYEQAVAALRARVVRALVDDEGVTLTGLARRMGISRQAVTRLYESAAPDGEDRHS
jgi:hypothetical protein